MRRPLFQGPHCGDGEFLLGMVVSSEPTTPARLRLGTTVRGFDRHDRSVPQSTIEFDCSTRTSSRSAMAPVRFCVLNCHPSGASRSADHGPFRTFRQPEVEEAQARKGNWRWEYTKAQGLRCARMSRSNPSRSSIWTDKRYSSIDARVCWGDLRLVPLMVG